VLPPPQHEQAGDPERRADAAEDPQDAGEHRENRAPVVLLEEADHGEALNDPERQAEERANVPIQYQLDSSTLGASWTQEAGR